MANIKEYNAGALGLQIPETGIEATAQAARRAGTFFNQAGEAITNVGQRLGSSIRDAGDAASSYITHREKSSGIATLSTRLDDAERQWNDILKDPKTDGNDPSVAAKFRSDVLQPSLEEWKSGFITEEGQNWAQVRVDQATEHFFKKTASDQSRLAAASAINNVDTVVGKAATSVYNDPRGLDFQLGLVEAAIMNTSPTMSPEAHEHLMGPVLRKAREQIVQSAFHGEVTRDPDSGDQILEKYTKKYGEYFKPADSSLFATYVGQQQRRAKAEDRAEAADKRRIRSEDSLEASYEWIAKLTDENGNIRTDLNKNFLAQMQHDRRLLPSGMAAVSAAFNRLKERGHGATDAPGLVNKLIDQALREPTDPQYVSMEEIAKDHIGVDLTWGSFNGIRNLVKTRNLPETKAETFALRSLARTLNSTFPATDISGIKDPAMAQARFEYENFFNNSYFAARARGIPWQELLGDGPNSLVSNETISKFKKVSPTSLLDKINEAKTPPQPGFFERFIAGEKAKRDAAGGVVTKPSSLAPPAKDTERAPTPPAFPPPAVPFAPAPGTPTIDIKPGTTRRPLSEIFGTSP